MQHASGYKGLAKNIKSLEHGKSVAVVSTSHASSLASQLSQLSTGNPVNGPHSSVHSTLEYHDMQSQQVNSGVRPMVFSGMVSEARKIVQESEDRAQGLEQLAQDVYKQAFVRIEELVNVAEILYQSHCNQAPSLQLLTEEVQPLR